MTDVLADLEAMISGMGETERADLDALLAKELTQKWLPNPGPQTEAYLSKADLMLYGGAAGGGKMLALDTPIPTPFGWTTMGDISPGDTIFDNDGNPAKVTVVSPIRTDAKAYHLTFDDGEEITACADHLWVTMTDQERETLFKRDSEWKARRRAKRPSRATGNKSAAFMASIAARNAKRATESETMVPSKGEVRTTQEIVDTLLFRGHRRNHSIRVAGAIDTLPAILPIDPYTLGAWLGDGSSANAGFTGVDPEIWEWIERAEYRMSHSTVDPQHHHIMGLAKPLRALDLLKNKHIPPIYLRGSIDQREALLQGLMDTDGHAALDGGCEFDNTNRRLIDGVYELVTSLGMKATITEGRAKLNGRDCGAKWRVKFMTNRPVFHLARKAARLKDKLRQTTRFRYIVDAIEVDPVPMRCIAVDSPSRQYLAGRGFIPTHNTDLILGLALTAHQRTVIFRRAFVDLRGMEERLIEINGGRDGYNASDKVLRLPGMVLEMGALEKPGAEQSWQGRPHDLICVERGTPVLMGDGSYTPIEDLRVGDAVQTLEGPRRVQKTFPVQRKRAVMLTVYDERGSVLHTQVQSSRHQVLTSAGWVCHGRFVSPRLSSILGPKLFQEVGRRSSAFCKSLWFLSSNLPSSIADRLHNVLLFRFVHGSGGQPLGAPAFGIPREGGESGFSAFDSQRRKPSPLALYSRTPTLSRPARQSASHGLSDTALLYGVSGGRKTSSPLNFPGGYRSDTRSYGERTLAFLGLGSEQAGVPLYLLQQGDAGEPIPTGSGGGGRERTHKHTRRIRSYVHPYSSEIRSTVPDTLCSEVSCSVREDGVKDLFDVQIEGANHYITKGGFINKNCFDEGAQLSAAKVAFVMGWLRSSDPTQRKRIVIGSNPPMGGDGDYLMTWFAPWLDPLFPNPAAPGELRWAIIIASETIWVDGPEPIERDGETYTPLSRTFIPARLDDNPYLKNSGYRAQLESLPEPLRSQLLKGDFLAGREDHAWQVIPSEWVAAANRRWEAAETKTRAMIALAADVALGGGDDTAIAALHADSWFAPIVIRKDGDVADKSQLPAEIAAQMLMIRRDGADLSVDGTGGWGSGVRSHLTRDHHVDCASVVFSGGSNTKTKDGKLGFKNTRAEMYWRFREALDPDSGDDVKLPPDARLTAELTAPRYTVKGTDILIESKDDIKTRVGSSPDRADAVVIAWHRRRAAVAKVVKLVAKPRIAAGGGGSWMGR